LFIRLAAKNIQLPWRSPAFCFCALAFTTTGITCLSFPFSGSLPALYLYQVVEPYKINKRTFRVGKICIAAAQSL